MAFTDHPASTDDCPACHGASLLRYTATSQVPCANCGSDTIPPTPGHPEEQGFYCEECGCRTTEDGKLGL